MELKYGVLAGIACVVWRAFSFYMGWPDSELWQYSSYIGILLMATGAYLCVIEKRKEGNGVISFGGALYTGLVVCFVISIMMGVHAYVYTTTVDPQRQERMVAKIHDAMVKVKASESEIKVMDEKQRLNYSPFGQVSADSGDTMIGGLFVSLVIAAFTRSKKNE